MCQFGWSLGNSDRHVTLRAAGICVHLKHVWNIYYNEELFEKVWTENEVNVCSMLNTCFAVVLQFMR